MKSGLSSPPQEQRGGRSRSCSGLHGVAPAAIQADQPARVAVKLDHLAAAGLLVQVVDVLGDDRLEPPRRFQGGDAEMGGVGLGAAEEIIENLLDLQPGLARPGQEIVDLDETGIDAAPQAARAAERGDAALHRYAGAGEGGGVPRLPAAAAPPGRCGPGHGLFLEDVAEAIGQGKRTHWRGNGWPRPGLE